MNIASLKKAGSLLLAGALALAGCQGEKGPAGMPGENGTTGPTGPSGPTGPAGQNGISVGSLAGTVTLSGAASVPVVGATVALSPSVQGVNLVTDAAGKYGPAQIPVGVYTVTFSAPNFAAQTKTVSIVAAGSATQNVALVATAPVVVSITSTGAATPGATVNLAATATALDGSTVQSTAWTLVGGAAATFGTANAAATTATLPDAKAFKAQLFTVLNQPAVTGETQYAPVQNRFKVQAISHHDLEQAGAVTVKATVTTTSGTYTATKVIATTLPFGVSTGLAQVPVNTPVVVHGKDLAAGLSYGFTLTGPAGSAAVLDDATSQNPVFTPDVAGTYTLTEGTSGTSLTIYAGTWKGVIDTTATSAALVNGAGAPVADSGCTGCHNSAPGAFAPDNFTPWANSGHSRILSDNVNAGGHYGEACFDCHTVGFDKNAVNNGVDDQSDYAQVLSSVFTNHGAPNANPLNWKSILDNEPKAAQLMNIQCENCHGPQTVANQSHGTTDKAAAIAARVSLDSGVCGRCHGEPARHGRYQQWAMSGHAKFATAIGEGTNASCSGCHSAQGALAWFAQLQGGNASRSIPAATITWTAADVQPQTCVVCHDPHDPGAVSSIGNDVKLRIQNDTPLLPGGFKALGVGKGAICITCHNSRNGEKTSGSGVVGLHEDGDAMWGTLAAYAAPHEACQGDVLMGRNAYFVSGVRSAHSNIPNACANCHMELVQAPAEVAMSGQTNHMFKADLSICSKCHGSFDGAGLQVSVDSELADLKATIEGVISSLYASGQPVSFIAGRTPQVSINGAAAVNLSTVVTFAASPVNANLLAKANWNYSLIEQDASKGVHNPSFAHDVLFATTQKVKAITTVQ